MLVPRQTPYVLKGILTMKKFVLLALFALSFLAAKPAKHDIPFPQCDPCPWVR